MVAMVNSGSGLAKTAFSRWYGDSDGELMIGGVEGVMFRHKLKPEWYLDLPKKPKNHKSLSWAFEHCRGITDKHPDYEAQFKLGRNAQCLVEHVSTAGGCCSEFLKLAAGKTERSFDMSNALSHFKSNKHMGSAAHDKARKNRRRRRRSWWQSR
jgi:hypothetical protein